MAWRGYGAQGQGQQATAGAAGGGAAAHYPPQQRPQVGWPSSWQQGQQAGAGGKPTGNRAAPQQQQQPPQQQQQTPPPQQQQPQQSKAAGKGAGAGAAQPPQLETYVVVTKGNDGNEVVVRTLVGEYTEHGSNHGRKVYKKATDSSWENNGEPVDVFLYYWDKRDGPDMEGWWFGNQLGGSQVWSHCNSASMTPPAAGWRIPWDGAVRPTLVVTPKGGQSQNDPMMQERLREVGASAAEAQHAAKQALDQARAAAGDYSSHEGIKMAEELLAPQVPVMNDLMKRLMELQRGVQGEPLRQFTQLGTSLRGAQQALTAELQKLRNSKAKAEQSEKQRAAEEKESGALQDVLMEATQKTNAAEDSVEKALITSEMIAAGGDDLDEVKAAVAATEQAAQEAQKAIGEARIYLNAKQASARRFESDKIKTAAAGELGKMQQQLQEAQNKLNPLKTVRQDFMQRTAVQKLVVEVLEKLSPAEVDVDRAEEATVMLSGDGLSKETMEQAEQAVAKASEHIATVLRFLEQKKKTAQGLALTEIGKMEERAKTSQSRLQEFRGAHKEAAERVSCETLLKEAAEKLVTVGEAVTRAADAEGPFLMGVEELPLEETLAAVKACETASTAANTAVSIARMFIATKIVEAKRFSAGPSKEAQSKLKDFQTELETHTKKLADLKRNTALRKKAATMREAEHEVQKAEELAKKVGEAAAAFEDDQKLLQLSSKEIRAASDETVKAEQAANAALIEARKFITARQIESKGKEMSAEVSSELIKYQTRLTTAQAEVGKYKKLSSTVEQRLAAKKVIEEARAKLKGAEEKVAKVVSMVDSLGSEETPEPSKEAPKDGAAKDAKEGEDAEGAKADDADAAPKGAKGAEHAAAEAQVALKTVLRFLEVQARAQGAAKDEIAKLQPVAKEAQEKLDAAVVAMRERSEKLLVDRLVEESGARVKEAEDCVKTAEEAEAAFNKSSTEEQPVGEASSALDGLEAALQAAHTTVGGAKTFLAMKRLAAKRLSERSAKTAVDQLQELQAKLETAAKKLGEAKKGMAERKLATVKREVSEKVVEVEQKVEIATAATKALLEGGSDVGPEEMKSACEKAGTGQADAQAALNTTRTTLLNRQRDAKVIATDSSMLVEINKMLEKLQAIQADLDKQKAQLREQEHRFVAQRLMKDAVELVEELEKKLETTSKVAEPLASDKEDFTAGVFLTQTIDALKASMKKDGKTPKEIFDAMAEGGVVKEEKFVAFCKELADLKDESGSVLSDEQLKSAFERLDEKGSGEVKEEELVEQLRIRFICASVISMTENISVKGSKTVRRLDQNEIVEALGEPDKDESVGLMRVKCRALKDDKEGFITVAGNQGTVYLEPYSPHAALQKKIEKALQDCADAAKEAQKYLEQKAEELKSVRTGPLAETKQELGKLRPRVSKVQYTHSQLKKKVAQSEKRMQEKVEAERKKRQEVIDRKAAAEMTAEVEALMQECTTSAEAAQKVAEKLLSSKGAELDNPLTAMEEAEKQLETVLESIDKASTKIKERTDSIRTSSKGPFTEARSMLAKMKVKVGALELKCKKQKVALKAARKEVANDAAAAVRSVLRAHVQKEAIKADELFAKLSEGQTDVPAKKLREFVEAIPDHGLKPLQLDIGFDNVTAGVTRLAFLEMLQEYHRVVKDIALTTCLPVKDSKTLRKLLVGEVVEVLEAMKTDEGSGLARIRCRALKDEKEGWATLRGNQGTDFLERSAKPYFCCEEEVPIQAAFEATSDEVAKAEMGDILEVLAGPLKEPASETVRARGKASKDGATGWITMKDRQGVSNLEPSKLLVCKQSIVITQAFDITEGKPMRKLDVGEALEIVEGPKEDPIRNLTRIKAKTKTDDKEGWVTMKGNQGTDYVEETTRHHICKRAVSMQSKLATDSKTLRTLEEGEIFEVLDGPKMEVKEGPNRAKCRNLRTGVEGWFVLGAKNVQQWTPHYKVAQATTMTDVLDIKEAKTIRKVEVGELLVALESPVLEKGAGLLRARVRAEKDGAFGFTTVRGNQGTQLLKPMLS